MKIHLPPTFITCLILSFGLVVDQHAAAQVPAVKAHISLSKNSAGGSFESNSVLKFRVFVPVYNLLTFSFLKFTAVSNAPGIQTL